MVFMHVNAYKRLKFSNTHKTLCADWRHIEMQQTQSWKSPTFLLDLVMDVCSLWQWHAGYSGEGEVRLHRAETRLWGPCLVDSWQTAANLTDWLSEFRKKKTRQQKSPAKSRHSREEKSRQCCVFAWCQAVRISRRVQLQSWWREEPNPS